MKLSRLFPNSVFNVIFFIILWASGIAAQAQNASKRTIDGTITDSESGEAMIGAAVYVVELKTGTLANEYGYYSLTLPEGNYTLRFSFVGYNSKQKTLSLNTDIKLNVGMELTASDEVIVTEKRATDNVDKAEMGKVVLGIDQIKSIPALLGEVDVIRTITLLPGVQSAGEGTTGLFVRGGANDQNLIMLDDAPVYNASHLLGFFSVFNPDAVKDMRLYKGSIPARYGNRLSSIIDIRMKDGNNKKMTVTGGIGSISSRLTLEAPIVKDKGSFIISGRRTYADVFLKLSNNENLRNNVLYFYDFNMKANYTIDSKNRIFASGYFGRDVLGVGSTFGLDWGNATATLRWNHVFSNKLFLNTTAIYSKFDYGFNINDGSQNFTWTSGLEDKTLKLDFDYFLNPKNNINFGIENTWHSFVPPKITPKDKNSIFVPFALNTRHALENAIYVSNEQTISPKLSLEYGLRYSFFSNIGKDEVYKYAEGEPLIDRNIIDTLKYGSGQIYNTYHGAEPRFSAKYTLRKNNSLKAAYARTRQYIQVVSNNTASLPFDRWIPSDVYRKPQIGDQFSLGYFHNFKDDAYEFSTELYYKIMQNQADVLDGQDVFLNANIEETLSDGKAWSYGAEFFLRKNTGALTGWISYTLSRTQRQIEVINLGQAYSPRYDRPHNLSVVASYRINSRMNVSATWVYYTGAAVTFPAGRYDVGGIPVTYYDPANRNGDRMPDYHRLDLGLTIDGKNKKNRAWSGSWNFSVYNAYNRYNAFSIVFRESEKNPGKMESVQTTLFGILPSVTYNFKILPNKNK
ncbi:MAG: TonB-dependent receptor [Cytophagales bacterium]|nr:MAG: TonB-dependent receptor [Cytophagales bacterium]TAF62496.1 MAG: TonB-dependent receptor [Cytophagales bacterium]